MQAKREREKKVSAVSQRAPPGGCGIAGRGGEVEERGCYRQTYVPPSHRHEVLELTGPGAQWDLHQLFPRQESLQ